MNLYLEGTDLIGKTSVCKIIEKWIPNKVFDRLPDFSVNIGMFDFDPIIARTINKHSDDMIFVLYTNNSDDLKLRLQQRTILNPNKIDEYDKFTTLYNRTYKNVLKEFGNDSVVGINIKDKTPYEIASEIMVRYLKRFVKELPPISLEGESKIYRSIPFTNLALVSLKPTLYSFTHNRYGEVEGTDEIRQNFWSLFGNYVNSEFSKNELSGIENMPSSFICNLKLFGETYTIVKFWENISPLEVIWKNYMVGTMKHNLKDMEKRLTLNNTVINYEDKLPSPIIRFDWRNNLPNKDECIPDDFASFYINTQNAKKTAIMVTDCISNLLKAKEYELVDLCYFMNYEGTQICGEISPDGMRIRKKGKSFDKDLWRTGSDKKEICKVWQELYIELSSLMDFN